MNSKNNKNFYFSTWFTAYDKYSIIIGYFYQNMNSYTLKFTDNQLEKSYREGSYKEYITMFTFIQMIIMIGFFIDFLINLKLESNPYRVYPLLGFSVLSLINFLAGRFFLIPHIHRILFIQLTLYAALF